MLRVYILEFLSHYFNFLLWSYKKQLVKLQDATIILEFLSRYFNNFLLWSYKK